MSAAGMTATVIATKLAQAVLQDEEGEGCDVSAGMFGPAASQFIRELAAAIVAADPIKTLAQATPFPGEVGDAFDLARKALRNNLQALQYLQPHLDLGDSRAPEPWAVELASILTGGRIREH